MSPLESILRARRTDLQSVYANLRSLKDTPSTVSAACTYIQQAINELSIAILEVNDRPETTAPVTAVDTTTVPETVGPPTDGTY